MQTASEPRTRSETHESSNYARNAGVLEGEDKVVAHYDLRGSLDVAGAAYYNPADIEAYEATTSYIGLSYQVSSVQNINPVTETFKTVIDLNFVYKIEPEDKEHYQTYMKQGSVNLQDIVDENICQVLPPVFEIRNAVATPEETSARIIGLQLCYCHRKKEWCWYVSVYKQYRVECFEEFEMHRFPFTRNSLQVSIQCKQNMNTVMLVPFNSRSALPHWRWDAGKNKCVQVFVRGNSLKTDRQSGNWVIEQHHAFFVPDVLLPPMPSGSKFSTCVICIQCKQSAKFFVANTAIIIFFLPILCVFTVVEDVQNVAMRMSMVLSLLLTMSTYKIVISEWIPQKDYLTFMDDYILMGFFIIIIIAFWVVLSGIAGRYETQGSQILEMMESFEFSVFTFLGIVWTLFHIYIGVTWHTWYLPWRDLLLDENERLQEIADDVAKERQDMQEVELLSCPEPDPPTD